MSVDLSIGTMLLQHQAWPALRAWACAVLVEQPDHGPALRLLAAACAADGELDTASFHLTAAMAADAQDPHTLDDLIRVSHLRGDLRRLEKALLARSRIDPANAAYRSDLGVVRERLGDASGAGSEYRRALALAPALANALANAANLAYRAGAWGAAAHLARRAAASGGAVADTLTIAGHALQHRRDISAAARLYRRAIATEPAAGSAWEGLAAIFRSGRKHDRTLAILLRTLALSPATGVTLGNVGEAYRTAGDAHRGAMVGRRALVASPDLSLASNSLSLAYGDLGEDRRATVWARRSLHLAPLDGKLMINLGIALKAEGRLHEAQRIIRAGLERCPDDTNGHIALATALLADGRIGEGLAEYEWRHRGAPTRYDLLPAPRWDGGRLSGGTLLVWGEQGLGDEVMFLQYLRRLKRLVPRLLVECDRRLVDMLRRSFPDIEFVGRTLEPAPRLFHADIVAQVALLSVPHLLGLDRAGLATEGPFLRPKPDRVAAMASVLRGMPRPLIGIAWRTGFRTPLAARVHTELAQWQPILAVPGVTFVNIQYGDVQREIDEAREQLGVRIVLVEDLDLFNDLEGVLALASQLDLVVSTGTSAAALPAAAGVETWYLQLRLDYLAFGADTLPFWARTRGFVREPGETWAGPIADVGAALRLRAAEFRRDGALPT